MFAGKLNELIIIEQPIKKENELGEIVDGYTKKFQTKAQVIYKSGVRQDDYSIHTEYSVQFCVRIYHSITEEDRVFFRGRHYRIDSIEYSREYQMQKLNTTRIDE